MGVVLALALGVVNAHSMIKLVKCSQHLSERKQLNEGSNKFAVSTIPVTSSSEKTSRTASDTSTSVFESRLLQSGLTSGKKEETKEKRVALNYGNMAEEAFTSSKSKWLGKLAKPIKFAVNLCVIGLQLGMCSAFYIFVEDHIIGYLFDKDVSRDMTFFAILPFFILIATVRSLVVLSWIGFIGNILVVIAIAIIVVQMLFMKHVPISHLPAVTSIEGVTLAAGSMIYAYSAQGVVLPLENKMRKPQDMLGFFGVISISVAFICTVYVTVGFLGYLTYGHDLKGSITLNLDNSP
ncbi:transmembrane amino acid transporter protein [Ancylostoma caninum]|uniref:Transmembrane amino acid transporter protein n=1 Tax=Ancylostoma caninum TaxID=29170 RepID=A0A368FJG9_ANCCA|nr:transmembrane amino acid transporter protein [Ancylostoma caninum]